MLHLKMEFYPQVVCQCPLCDQIGPLSCRSVPVLLFAWDIPVIDSWQSIPALPLSGAGRDARHAALRQVCWRCVPRCLGACTLEGHCLGNSEKLSSGSWTRLQVEQSLVWKRVGVWAKDRMSPDWETEAWWLMQGLQAWWCLCLKYFPLKHSTRKGENLRWCAV